MDPFIIFYIIVLILSIILHEVSHGFAAEWLGDPTARLNGRLTLNPLPHIDPLGSIIIPGLLVFTHAPFLFGWAKPVPYNPYNLRNQKWGEAIVAAAGPGVNILLALGFGFLIRFGGDALSPAFVSLASIIVIVNIMLASINERIREIGLCKAVGASGLAIFTQILIESVVIALLGAALGVGASYGLVAILALISPSANAPLITPLAMAIAVAFSALVGVSAGLFPAWKAARLNPIQALRNE